MMKYKKFVVPALSVLCILVFGCENGTTDIPPDTLDAVQVQEGETRYYSLSTGERIPEEDKNTTDWDIAFTRQRLVLTNSGATAEAAVSGGQGGVWYSGKTIFDSVTIADKGDDGDDFSSDTALYVWTGMSLDEPTARTPLNVMTYVGYSCGDGSTSSFGKWDPETKFDGDLSYDYTGYPADGPLSGYTYEANQYYENTGGMPPVFRVTNKVYIIRHADGISHSKIQIVYEYVNGADVYKIRRAILSQ
jgi:hypothetical protein